MPDTPHSQVLLTLPPDFRGRAIPLTSLDVRHAAEGLEVPERHLRVLLVVETRDQAYLPDGRQEILLEQRQFQRLTHGAFDRVAPDLSNPSWGRNYGPAGAHQYTRLTRAMALDRDAALAATSWGIGQVMGFNAGNLGYASAEAMVAAFCDSAAAQLDGVVRYLVHAGIVAALRRGDWRTVTRGYNGTGQVDHYATMCEQVDAAMARGECSPHAGPAGAPRLLLNGMRGTDVETLQQRLDQAGYPPGPTDGVFGARTLDAVKALQRAHHLDPDGVVGPATRGVLALATAD